jgi:hypothetical protein
LYRINDVFLLQEANTDLEIGLPEGDFFQPSTAVLAMSGRENVDLLAFGGQECLQLKYIWESTTTRLRRPVAGSSL